MSVEIEDFTKFELLVLEFSNDEKSLKNFHYNFQMYILGNPSDGELGSREVINKAITFFSKQGLKIAYSEGDGTGSNWSYAIQENNSLEFIDCLK
ncbi:hypothetical protein SDC9_210929 [bioreactor metagenome]|uniref:Uncharacterized protein n=1 Tax=bioreactor metagenome TaxID=1076179 RepID=A0A645JT00_9ZZZZ